jgi:integrase
VGKKRRRYNGVFSVKGKLRTSYGIDYTHPQTGQRIRKIIKGCQSESQAAGIRSLEIADAARGAIKKAYGPKLAGPPVLFEDMVTLYLDTWAKTNRDYRTAKNRAAVLRRAFTGKLMSDITPWVIEKFKASEAKEKSKNTVNKYLSLGSQVYEKAIEWGKYEGGNPFLKASRFKVKKGKKPGSLSPEEVTAIMFEIRNSVKRAMVEFAFNTGWRISEITRLKWENVNLERGCAWIVDPKNGESVEIELNDRALKVISEQERRGDFVFCHMNGEAFKTGLRDVFKKAEERAGVVLPKRKAWHILRRTWASMFLQAGGDVETLRVLGNWKDYSMPMWYADSSRTERRREVLNRIPDLNGRKKAEVVKNNKLTK